MLNEFVLLGGTLAAGFVLGMLVVALRRRPRDVVELEVVEDDDAPSAPSDTAAPTLKAGAPEDWDEAPFTVTAPATAPPPAPAAPPATPAARPAPRAPAPSPAAPAPARVAAAARTFEEDARWRRPADAQAELPLPPMPANEPPSHIPTEWARRQVGPLEPGRVKGACSGCGTMLSISTQRPLRIACPVCGRTRLLA